MILVGPSFILPDSFTIMFIGQLYQGIMLNMFVVAPLLEMTDVSVPRFPTHKVKVTDMSAGFFNGSLCIGQLLGPLYGSMGMKLFGFRST